MWIRAMKYLVKFAVKPYPACHLLLKSSAKVGRRTGVVKRNACFTLKATQRKRTIVCFSAIGRGVTYISKKVWLQLAGLSFFLTRFAFCSSEQLPSIDAFVVSQHKGFHSCTRIHQRDAFESAERRAARGSERESESSGRPDRSRRRTHYS